MNAPLTRTALAGTLLVGGLLAGCAGEDTDDSADTEETEVVDDPLVGTCDGSETTSTTVLDTTSATDWVYYDLDTAAVVTETDAWDLRMRQWTVELGAGVEAGGVEGAYEQFDERCLAPSTMPERAIADWYAYNMATHVVSPADVMYYVKTTEGAYQRLRFDGYYEDAGTVHTPGLTHGSIDSE